MPRRWAIAALLGACLAVCAPAAAAGPSRVTERFAPAGSVEVRFAVMPGPRRATLATLARNRLALRLERRRLMLRRAGRSVPAAALAVGGHGWTRVTLTVDIRTGSVRMRARGRRVAVRLTGLREESTVVVGGAGRPRLRDPQVTSVAAAPRGGDVPAGTGAAAPAPPDAATSPPAPASPPGSTSPPRAATARFFAADSFWNAPLPNDAPLDVRSSDYVAELRRQLTLASPWINTTQYSTPIYTVGPDQPMQRVTLDTDYWPLQREWEAVPIPADARPAAGRDGHLVVHQPSTDTLWEFWRLQRGPDGWHARWGGRMTGVSASPGHFAGARSGFGATATSLPLVGGLMTLEELRRGSIDHALALAIPQPKAREWSWPAQRTDGSNWNANAIPEGARFRLDPALDLRTLNLPPLIHMMAAAAQRYGIVVRDKAGAVVFFGEDSTPTGADAWRGAGGFFGGQWPNRLLERFPWDRLQVLRTDMRCCWKG